MKSAFEDVARSIHALYAEHPYLIAPEFSDFHIEVRTPRNLRRWLRPQAEFLIDGEPPFEPLPRDQAPALLEWGMNWTIASSCHQWITLHAASLERNGFALILPAPPGSGKSTLCAALALRGWRLLSDELTLLEPDTLFTNALARPINLKNASIDLMREFAPTAIWSPESYDTQKGRIAHLRPPAESVRCMTKKSAPRWVVFPKYVPDADPLLLRNTSQVID
jgi:HprK-related kinase A